MSPSMIRPFLAFVAGVLILGFVLSSKNKYGGVSKYQILGLEEEFVVKEKPKVCRKINKEFNQNTKDFIDGYTIKEDEPEQVKTPNRSALDILLSHSLNFHNLLDGYKEGKMDLLVHYKLKLYPGYNSKLKTLNQTKISEQWQKIIFTGLDLEKICKILIRDPNSMAENKGVLRVIKENQDIRRELYALITEWIGQFLPKADKIFLHRKYESFLIWMYRGNQGTLEDHIMSRLYPDSFFPLKDIYITEKTQKAIFGLLKLRTIALTISEYSGLWNQKDGIKAFFQQETVLTKLRDTVISHYWKDLVEVLVKIPVLSGLPKEMPWEKDQYNSLCRLVSEKIVLISIIQKELYRATNGLKEIGKICPDNFFSLEKTGLIVNPVMQGNVFGLLFREDYKMSAILVELGYNQQETYNFEGFIKQKEIIQKLRDMVIECYWGELVDILVQMPRLKDLPFYSQHWSDNHYENLCNFIVEKVPVENVINGHFGQLFERINIQN